jgi:D-cysteine desulfhydrase/L-cysteate sulfo-lyase
MDFDQLARVEMAHLPTPVEPMPRLSQALGGRVQLSIKRDDCTGLGGGGNKTRKLEYLLADARQQGADTLVTIGGIQSNHARQTAAAAAKQGLACELVLEDVSGTPKTDYYNNGNLLLDKLFGARLHYCDEGEDCNERAERLAAELRTQGRNPYLIPVGGSNETGSLGYVRCANEILAQTGGEIDRIVLASGSAGTQAGLLAGLMLAGSTIPVLGICVSRSTEDQQALVTELLRHTLDRLGYTGEIEPGRVQADGGYYGEGYGIATDGMLEAVRLTAQSEGVLLDPVYTGKGMAGLIDLVRQGWIAEGERVLFLHTGGSPGLFAYRELF